MKAKVLLVVVLLSLVLAACMNEQPVSQGSSLYRILDCDYGVVCWKYTSGGVFCLPISQTRLAYEDVCSVPITREVSKP